MVKDSTQRRLYLDSNLQIIFAVSLMAVLGVPSITPAFPKMIQELRIPTESVGLLITAFTLPGVLLTLVFGVIADKFGRKKVLVPSLLLFGLAGVTCALVRSFELLLALRFLQGIGGASLGSLNITVIGDLYTGKDQKDALAYNASVLGLGTAAYPIIGGALASLEWYYPFVLPIISVPIAVVVHFSLQSPKPMPEHELGKYLKDTGRIIKTENIIVIFVISIITFIILFGTYQVYLPIFLDDSFGASPLIIGLVMSAVSLVNAVTAVLLPKIAMHHSDARLLQAAFILYSLALVVIPFIELFWAIMIPSVIFGLAHGINIPTMHSALARKSPLEYRAAIISLNHMVLRLGQTLGPLIMGLMFVVGGIYYPFVLGFFLSLLMFLIILVSTVKSADLDG